MHRCDAKMIGVSVSTTWNWEHGTEPELRHMPKIIDEFLGYAPFECPEYPIEKLKYLKLVKGLSYEKLGKMMGRDPEQLMDWLSGRVKPCKKNLQELKSSYFIPILIEFFIKCASLIILSHCLVHLRTCRIKKVKLLSLFHQTCSEPDAIRMQLSYCTKQNVSRSKMRLSVTKMQLIIGFHFERGAKHRCVVCEY